MKEFFAYVAGTLTAVSLVPQLLKLVRTQKASDLSLPSFVILALSFCFWILYGFIDFSLTIMLAFAFALASCLALVHFIIRVRDQKHS